MKFRLRRLLPVLTLLVCGPCLAAPVKFGREVLPILSDNCFACHGRDESTRKAGLRLDTREGATVVNDGIAAIVPGKPEQSELLKRILATDPDEVMPPPSSHKKKLSAAQIETLRLWIKEGAVWGKHWAFEKPVKETLPTGAVHPIDAFVLTRLAQERLKFSPTASRAILARRVSFDLTGLPPSSAELTSFEKDKAPDAYEKFVDKLLASPHFGERMAMWWLDAARYADTDGFQGDDTRTNWPWRDWVIDAFNSNMPFDRFTIEQCAGDLLPNATPEQRLATCFHRNHMTNGEGGRDPEESRVDYVIDRVNTTGTLWLGLTVGCAQCHSHKFDPVSQSDYYSLSAFFDSINEDGKAGRGAKPFMSYESPRVARALMEAQALVDERQPAETAARTAAQAPFATWLTERIQQTRGGFAAWQSLHGDLESSEGTVLTQEADGTVQASGPNPKQDDYRLIAPVKLPRVAGLKLEVFPHTSHTGGSYSRGQSGFFTLTDVKLQVRRRGSSQVRDIVIASAVADVQDDPAKRGGYGDVKHTLDDDPRNGWSTRDFDPKAPRSAVFGLAEPLLLAADEELIFELRHRSTLGDGNIGRFRVLATAEGGPTIKSVSAAPLEELAAADPQKLDEKLRARLLEQFLSDYAPYLAARVALDRATRQLAEVKSAQKVDVMVLEERPQPRSSFVLVRGLWDKKGDQVRPGVPEAIAPLPQNNGAAHTRLDMAKWLVSPDNPLTARVIVNHLWQLCFGAGLVRTPDDFGLQGERPTHPELLDWLAVDFVEHGWNIKRTLRLIVTSQTYRQSSDVPPSLLARDPENRILARGARFRLASWMLRDAALQRAALLNPALGGPPVRPYQPDGVWEELFMGRFRYEPSEGPAQYRRTIYAFWRRAIAPVFLFDSAQRRVCEVRQSRTNTPLQALALLNDKSYLEASRALATLALHEATTPPLRLNAIARRVLLRDLKSNESKILAAQLARAATYYRANPGAAAKLLGNGQGAPDTRLNSADLAATMLAASTILNLDESITHE